jgi:hypothetical protein
MTKFNLSILEAAAAEFIEQNHDTEADLNKFWDVFADSNNSGLTDDEKAQHIETMRRVIHLIKRIEAAESFNPVMF